MNSSNYGLAPYPLVNCWSIDSFIIWVHTFILYSVALTASISRMCFHDLNANPTVALRSFLTWRPPHLISLHSKLCWLHSIYTGQFSSPCGTSGSFPSWRLSVLLLLSGMIFLHIFTWPSGSLTGWFYPPGVFGNTWRHFLLSWLGDGVATGI